MLIPVNSHPPGVASAFALAARDPVRESSAKAVKLADEARDRDD